MKLSRGSKAIGTVEVTPDPDIGTPRGVLPCPGCRRDGVFDAGGDPESDLVKGKFPTTGSSAGSSDEALVRSPAPPPEPNSSPGADAVPNPGSSSTAPVDAGLDSYVFSDSVSNLGGGSETGSDTCSDTGSAAGWGSGFR